MEHIPYFTLNSFIWPLLGRRAVTLQLKIFEHTVKSLNFKHVSILEQLKVLNMDVQLVCGICHESEFQFLIQKDISCP